VFTFMATSLPKHLAIEAIIDNWLKSPCRPALYIRTAQRRAASSWSRHVGDHPLQALIARDRLANALRSLA